MGRIVSGCWAGRRDISGTSIVWGDVALDLIVIEELGDVRANGLNTILQGNDAERATRMLGELMSAVGRIHAAGFGHEDNYRRIRASLPSRSGNDFHTIHRFEELLAQFANDTESAGYQVPALAQTDLNAVMADLREPGQFRGLSHGDIRPSNAIQQNQQVRLFDLVVCGIRQVLLDGVYPQLRYLCCQETGRIPATVQQNMASVYRAELVKWCLLANDDDAYGRGLVVAGEA